jgi:hypothetical protein
LQVHLVSFSIVSLRPFDVDAWVASGGTNLTYTGKSEKPVPWQAGYKDTVAVPVGYTVKVAGAWACVVRARPRWKGGGAL